jgi:hypothetical protein
MKLKGTVSFLTKRNWILDIGLFLTGIAAIVSGIYFLIFPDGGYKGGRNPYYGIQIIFEREGWEWMHTWISLGMIAIAMIHLIFHWKWVVGTFKRIATSIKERKSLINAGSRQNIVVNGLLAVSFVICAASGVYLLLVPELKGNLTVDPMILFSRTTWDLLHTWSGVAFIASALFHFVIHWGWVTKVTRKIVLRKSSLSLEQNSIVTNI